MLVLCEILKADWSVLKWRTTHDFYGSPLRLSENFVNFTEGYFIFTSTYDLYISINSRRFLDIKIICFVTTVAVALCCCPLPCRNRRFCDADGWLLSFSNSIIVWRLFVRDFQYSRRSCWLWNEPKGAFHLSELTGQTIPVVMRILLLIKTFQPDPSNPKYYARRRWFFSKNCWEKPISL